MPKGSRLVPGIHSVNEAFKIRPEAVTQIFVKPGFESSTEVAELKKRADRAEIPWQEKNLNEMDRIYSGHQGILAVVDEEPELDWDVLKTESPCTVLILDGIEDPHNLGAILRTAWLMDAKAVFVPEARSAHLGPAAMKVASGGAEHVPVVADSSLPSVMEQLKEMGFWLYGLSHRASSNLWQMEFPEKVAWVVGSEQKGIRKPVERACDDLVRIPQVVPSASYNASVSVAMALSETVRQQTYNG